MMKKPNILERSLQKSKNAEINLSAFTFMFSEMIQYSQKRVHGIQDLEKKLSDYGYRVGIRVLELSAWREKSGRRETRVLPILYFITGPIWKMLFGKQADSLEKGTENEDEYMISDNEPILSKFISIPREMSLLNPSAFVGGIVEAILDGSQFPCRVTAHSTPIEGFPLHTTILIKFDKSVMQREKAFETR
ncbi:NO signaling/Golgi transport ligand-binding domain-containing protein [Polychytrium aggregatum]|uniref:NO signaling/Golgi transport ligand-binding domain-containing protein n=1 Tax=Polychytrium aggregatum TaxID=110093 RepID=UPI0022FEC9CC|nr:NO signaling/Golgi transport ligand-binding domain-containing protein [Polychytrium aggregatum]KAI9208674.1 NO signaling/Golgi transport ligand-binding domain-containing protein [Polychytrium aggregatum]